MKGSEAENLNSRAYSAENICCHSTVALTLHLHNIAYFLADPGISVNSTLVLLMYQMHTYTVQEYLCMQITLTLLCSGQYQLLRYSTDNEHRMCVCVSVYMPSLYPTSLTQYSN